MKKIALITGIAGQDGSYLAELLLQKNYEVHGMVRVTGTQNLGTPLVNLDKISKNLTLHAWSSQNPLNTYEILSEIQPTEIYHLASSSFVSYNFDDEISLIENNLNATHSLFVTIKKLSLNCRVYFAGSSEMFGNVNHSPQNEKTPFFPRSVYGISKLAAYHLARNYREHHGLNISTGILYNHESPRRTAHFVTRKITSAVAKIYLGQTDSITLGNIDAIRDWGYAPDYVNAMYLMLQQESPKDYVIATGKLHSVRDFLEEAFGVVNLDYQKYLKIDRALFRPSEPFSLCGDSTRARVDLGWHTTTRFEEIVREMVLTDINLLRMAK